MIPQTYVNGHDFKWCYKWKTSAMILIDDQNAFDILDFKIFLDKMKCIGFSNKATRRIHVLPHKQLFLVSLNVFSEAGTINCGVPQGSIL